VQPREDCRHRDQARAKHGDVDQLHEKTDHRRKRRATDHAGGHLIADVLDDPADDAVITRARNGVAALTRKFPVYR